MEKKLSKINERIDALRSGSVKITYHPYNGVYFRADSEITVSHTSHATVTLPAGEYRLYMSSEPDAD